MAACAAAAAAAPPSPPLALAPAAPPAAPPAALPAAAAAAAAAPPAPLPRRVQQPTTFHALDRAQFASSKTLTAVRVRVRDTEPVQRALSRSLLRMHWNANIRPVVRDPADDGYRLLLLAEGTPADLSTLPAEQRQAVDAAGGTVVAHTVALGYEHMTADEVLRAVIPPGLAGKHDLPASFEVAGTVAHVNLREEYLPWKYVVGQVILDKNPALRSVINKTGAIHETFRTFPMEVLAGPGDTHVEVRHCGATFRFDFARVYWNSRLAYEHEHVVTRVVPPGSVVADLMAGVGPFAVPLALAPRGCAVHANDLNPASHAALVDNVRRNKVAARVTTYNMDARAFVRALVRARVPFSHALMNLPADAIEFCDAFVGLYRGAPLAGGSGGGGGGGGGVGDAPPPSAAGGAPPLPLPCVHTYCFVKSPESMEAAQATAASRLMRALLPAGAAHPPDGTPAALAAAVALLPDLSFRHIRDVSPRKMMLCVSFTLPRCLALAEPKVAWDDAGGAPGHAAQPEAAGGAVASGDGPAAKRQRVGGDGEGGGDAATSSS